MPFLYVHGCFLAGKASGGRVLVSVQDCQVVYWSMPMIRPTDSTAIMMCQWFIQVYFLIPLLFNIFQHIFIFDHICKLIGSEYCLSHMPLMSCFSVFFQTLQDTSKADSHASGPPAVEVPQMLRWVFFRDYTEMRLKISHKNDLKKTMYKFTDPTWVISLVFVVLHIRSMAVNPKDRYIFTSKGCLC